jgi:integrase
MERRITEKFVNDQLKRARLPKNRDEFWDTRLRNFGFRITSTRAASYLVGGRFGGPDWKRLTIGSAPAMSFDEAEEKAREWLKLDGQGKDPREVEAERARAAERKRGHSFNAIADEFVADRVIGVQRPKQVGITKSHIALMRKAWGGRQIHDITPADIKVLIKSKKAHRAAAANLWTDVRRLFKWAYHQEFGLESNAAASLKFEHLIPKPKNDGTEPDKRVLSIEEVRAIWRATAVLDQPFQAAYRMLILSGLRVSECAGGLWSECNFETRTWLIPGNRMTMGRPFAVPLTDHMLTVINSLPPLSRGLGRFLFSVNNRNAVHLGSMRVKRRLDAELSIPEWVNHDLRTAAVTALTGMGIKVEVTDAALAHKRPGIKGKYNVYDYFDERRDALQKWGDAIVPDDGNVVSLRRAG